jgi:hypothetical protein
MDLQEFFAVGKCISLDTNNELLVRQPFHIDSFFSLLLFSLVGMEWVCWRFPTGAAMAAPVSVGGLAALLIAHR